MAQTDGGASAWASVMRMNKPNRELSIPQVRLILGHNLTKAMPITAPAKGKAQSTRKKSPSAPKSSANMTGGIGMIVCGQ